MNENREVGLEIRRMNNLIRREVEKFECKRCGDKDLGTNGWILGYIYDHRDKDVFQKDIEDEFTIRRSTVSNILKLLEQKGMIVREPVSYDARLKRITLTEEAIDIHMTIRKDVSKLESKLTKGISKEEIDMFFNIMKKFQKNILE
ncbi:MarR family transcriptional regulator [Clostridium sp. MSJ-8]|uniref:MarR family winged helix-turn-helix transcriptional regulator n=1 Tax=Clostridium sp. MSJ-8 TaxID=2841510 RepID=UPI001C0EC121|nr:MarR family transcriptional regulator [Clostridium sp. MSJ-8]